MIIDIPEQMMRLTMIDWDIDWRSMSSGSDVAGGEQIGFGRFPRFTGKLDMLLMNREITYWRGLRAKLRGRANLARVIMFDPISREDFVPVNNFNPDTLVTMPVTRPMLKLLTAVLPGDTTLLVDERLTRQPVAIGAFLSYNDWPMIVTGRTGSGASVTLTVEMLRVAIPANADIDLKARGIFRFDSDMTGATSYGTANMSSPSVQLTEWVTR